MQNEVQTLFNKQLGAFAGALETQAMWLVSELSWYDCRLQVRCRHKL
jgi:hypothetical protein